MSYLDQIKKAKPQAPVITIVGFPGVGKSTLAATFPKPVFIQAENATSVFESLPDDDQPAFFPELPAPNAKRDIRPSVAMLDQLRELITVDHPYQTVVIDAVTTLNTLFENEVVAFDPNGADNIGEAAGGYGKGFLSAAKLHSDIRNACEHLRRKGMTVIFLAHSGIAKIKNRPDQEPYATWTLDMPEASRKIYIATSDAVLYLKSREFVMGADKDKKGAVKTYGKVTSTGERILVSASEGTIGFVDAKNRYKIPQELEVNEGENPIMQYIPFYGVLAPAGAPESTDANETQTQNNED